METKNNSNMVMGILSYLGPLVIISYLVSRHDPLVKFHIKQGLVLFGIEVIVWILSPIFWPLWLIWSIINLATFVLSIIGIVNVVQGKQNELPITGRFAKNFSF